MPLYFYQAFAKDGKKVSGYLDAPSSVFAKDQLVRQGLFPTTINLPQKNPVFLGTNEFLQAHKNKRQNYFNTTISVLLKAGIPLLQAIELLCDQFTGTCTPFSLPSKMTLKKEAHLPMLLINILMSLTKSMFNLYARVKRAAN